MEAFVILIIAVLIYFIPSFIASSKEKSNSGAIFVLNLFLGWSLIGWVVALVWACTNDTDNSPVIEEKSIVNELKSLEDLRNSGSISDEEFKKLKAKLID